MSSNCTQVRPVLCVSSAGPREGRHLAVNCCFPTAGSHAYLQRNFPEINKKRAQLLMRPTHPGWPGTLLVVALKVPCPRTSPLSPRQTGTVATGSDSDSPVISHFFLFLATFLPHSCHLPPLIFCLSAQVSLPQAKLFCPIPALRLGQIPVTSSHSTRCPFPQRLLSQFIQVCLCLISICLPL